MNLKTGFEPIIGLNPKILILGSMPGVASLEASEYYAHPRNAFWKIISDVFQQSLPNTYAEKKLLAQKNHLALWDVIQSCKRKGSLDSAIEKQSIIENNIIELLAKHSTINKIGLNGGKAFDIFIKQYVKTHLLPKHITFEKLPSTSPAYTKPYHEKLLAWHHFLVDSST